MTGDGAAGVEADKSNAEEKMPIVARKKAQRRQGVRPAAWIVVAAVAACAGLWALPRMFPAAPEGNDTEAPPPAAERRDGVADAGRASGAAAPGAVAEADAPAQPGAAPTVAGAEVAPATPVGRGDAAKDGREAGKTPAEAEAPSQQADAPEGKFDNDVENMLESVSRFGFESIETLRVNLPKDEIVAILNRPVDIYEDDPPDVVADKERTAEMKKAALEFIEAGGTFNQFLRDMQAQATEEREAVKDVREEMVRILRVEGEAAARAYLDKANPELAAQGLPEVHLGKGLLRMVEREAAKAAAQAQ